MIALDPRQTFSVTLDIESEKPAEQRTKFRFYFLTAKKLIEAEEFLEAERALTTIGGVEVYKLSNADRVAKLLAALKIGVADKAEQLAECLTLPELREVAYKMIAGARIEESERKKSALQSASAAAAKSASDATPSAAQPAV